MPKIGACRRIFFSGRSDAELRHAGVAFFENRPYNHET